MKLYTEEQLMKTWNTAFTEALKLDKEDYMPTFYGEFINGLTHIELPSDEEIDNKLDLIDKYHIMKDFYCDGFKDGAKYIIDKIQGGNK